MHSPNVVQIFSHLDSRSSVWKSNYEKENFWPAKIHKTGWTTRDFVSKLQIIFSQNHSDYSIDVQDYQNSTHGYYLIFYGSSPAIVEHHGLAFLTSEIVTKCNQGILKLLIVFTHETFDGRISIREWYSDFCGKLSSIGIKKSHSVVILSGTKCVVDLNADDRCEFIYYPWFEADLQASFRLANKSCPSIDFNKKNKHYINLNLAIRQHRFLMILYLKYRGVDCYGNISWKNSTLQNWRELIQDLGRDQHGLTWIGQLDKFDHGRSHFLNFIKDINVLDSIRLDDLNLSANGPHNGMTWYGAQEFYEESYVDLISETHHELHGDVFLTEKTFKPMAYGLPFIFNASRNYLDLVKKLGYHSFPELFDEHYDTMPSSMEKIAAIGEEIVAFCTQPQGVELIKNSPEILEKLQYNQNLFWNKNHPQELGTLLHSAWIKGRA